MKHLVFYDGKCGLCDRCVQFLLRVDKEKKFVFAPLQGMTAKSVLKDLPSDFVEEDSLILVEDYRSAHPRFYNLGRAVLRTCWLLGGWWKLIGWKCFLPSWPFDVGYRLVARNRHRFFRSDVCIIPQDQERFLP